MAMKNVVIGVLLVAALCLPFANGQTGDFTTGNMIAWRNRMAQNISQVTTEVLQVPLIQSRFDFAWSTIPTAFDAAGRVEALADSISSALDEKKDVVKAIADVVTDGYAVRSGSADADYANMTDPTTLPAMTFEERVGSVVNIDASGVRVPFGVDSESLRVQEAIAFTSGLDVLFRENYDNYPDLKWQYFGSFSGLHRSYPVKEWGKNGDGEYTDYDPRLRPWYVSASAGSKNVIILIDASSTMKLSGRFEIAQKLAKFALDSLTSNDYVNVIMFNDAAESSDCFPERLVRATGPTVDRLKTYIDDYNPSGSSRSGPGFETAFAYINDGVLEGTASSCNSVILMISDNLATDPTDVIARENPTNDVAVFTYTIGNDADQEVAKALTCDNRGIWQHIESEDPTDGQIRGKLAAYNAYYALGIQTSDVSFSLPYLDAITGQLFVTASTPVYDETTTPPLFVGVVGNDLSMTELLSGAAFTDGLSYTFIINENGEALYHPQIPTPEAWENNPVYEDISTFETADGFEAVRTAMLAQETGSTVLVVNLEIPAGDENYAGTRTVTTSMTYFYAPIEAAQWSICFVVATSELNKPLLDEAQAAAVAVGQQEYHRIDVKGQGTTLNPRYMGLRVETSFSSFKISPRGYVDSKAYLSEPETLSGVTALESEINVGAATGSVVEGTRGDVLLTSAVEAEWISAFSGNAGAYWAYIGTLSGVFRIYPATVAAKTYDPTLRPWFWRATAFPGQHAVSTPYYDATGAGKVVTISQVIYEGRGSGMHDATDTPAAVAGLDFQLDAFTQILSDATDGLCQFEGCSPSTATCCLVIDKNGYLISHFDFDDVADSDEAAYSNVWIGEKEGYLTDGLIDAGILRSNDFTNYREGLIQEIYTVDDDVVVGSYEGTYFTGPPARLFKIIPITDTNAYLIMLYGYQLFNRGNEVVPSTEELRDDQWVCVEAAKPVQVVGAETCPNFVLEEDAIQDLRPPAARCQASLTWVWALLGGVAGVAVIGACCFFIYKKASDGGDKGDDEAVVFKERMQARRTSTTTGLGSSQNNIAMTRVGQPSVVHVSPAVPQYTPPPTGVAMQPVATSGWGGAAPPPPAYGEAIPTNAILGAPPAYS